MRRAAWVVVAAAGAAALVLRRRVRSGARERVELYYSDGSTVTLGGSSEAGRRLVGLAGDVVAASRR